MTVCSSNQSCEFPTWLQLLQRRAADQADSDALIFLADGEREQARLSYAELDRRARAIASKLQDSGATGERVLLLGRGGIEYVAAFFGCLYAGAIAVTVYPPRPNRTLDRVLCIAEDCDARFAIAEADTLSRARSLLDQSTLFERCMPVAVDEVDITLAQTWQQPAVDGQSLAYLQYTSGSMSNPKGVMVSHANLLHNTGALNQAGSVTANTVFASWLPLFHDMGLIGSVLTALRGGSRCILMPPEAFLIRPIRWLRAISRYRAQVGCAPNFAFDLCVDRTTAAQREGLDLSSWTVACNGGERVRNETMQRFWETFKPYGFRHSTWFAAYGLAEATLLVTGSPVVDGPIARDFDADAMTQGRVVTARTSSHWRTLVACGRTSVEDHIEIVNPDSHTRCAADTIGEIWVRGPSVTQGYWNQYEQTQHTFAATLADTGEGPFLRTGDLGFIFENKLFVSGRLKDLIIVGGLNHSPEDIEHTVRRCHAALSPNRIAAFSVPGDTGEKLVIATEIKRKFRSRFNRTKASVPSSGHKDKGTTAEEDPVDITTLRRAVQQAVTEHHDLHLHDFVLLQPGGCPVTTSGKVRRLQCCSDYLAGALPVLEKDNDEKPRGHES